jgi:hypothetical protein
MKMTLYHGTSDAHLHRIIKQGLRPRGVTPSTFPAAPSHPDRVYLTNSYAFYFGAAAHNATPKSTGVLIVQCEALTSHLVPDEDFLEQQMRGRDGIHTSMEERTEHYKTLVDKYDRPTNHRLQHLSLRTLGTVAHVGPVKAAAIKRIVRVDGADVARITLQENDPTISLANYKYCGAQYRAWTADAMTRFPTVYIAPPSDPTEELFT